MFSAASSPPGELPQPEASVPSNHTVRIDATSQRLVVVRYFLDRPGYSLSNASARIWKDPPVVCRPAHVLQWLTEQGIVACNDDNLLTEIYLDKYHCFMLLAACEADAVYMDFSAATSKEPGVLNIRLTDLSAPEASSVQANQATSAQICNTSPCGLFAFSMTVGLEATDLLYKLGGSVDASFVLIWGPYAFFVSGLLQLIVGCWEVKRNNIYGATAFMTFGCFWLANGTKLLFQNYFPDQIPEELLGSDATGNFIRHFYMFAFVAVLWKQTLILNKLTTTMISLLLVALLAASLTGFNEAFKWIQMIMLWVVSIAAFGLFSFELTNEMYQREVFEMFPWSIHSPAEAFGAAGRQNTLQSKAIQMRKAHADQDTNNSIDTTETTSFPPASKRASANATLRAVLPGTKSD